MKIVINKCYGVFSLSMKAVKRIAELQGRPCYFFKQDYSKGIDAPMEKISEDGKPPLLWSAFDIEDPNALMAETQGEKWHKMTQEQRIAANKKYSAHCHDSRPDDRTDKFLVQVVEELGKEANGSHAILAVIEIPDGVEWSLDEYDGIETVHECHRSWS